MSNGEVARMVGTIKHTIKKPETDNMQDWDKIIRNILFGYRTRTTTTMKPATFEVLFEKSSRVIGGEADVQ